MTDDDTPAEPRTITCGRCGGCGTIDWADTTEDCPACQGDGYVEV